GMDRKGFAFNFHFMANGETWGNYGNTCRSTSGIEDPGIVCGTGDRTYFLAKKNNPKDWDVIVTGPDTRCTPNQDFPQFLRVSVVRHSYSAQGTISKVQGSAALDVATLGVKLLNLNKKNPLIADLTSTAVIKGYPVGPPNPNAAYAQYSAKTSGIIVLNLTVTATFDKPGGFS